MASSFIKECGVCNEEFDEYSRRPRSLPCSHCICSECIDKLIARNKRICPFCRRCFEARSAHDIGVNTGLLEALKFIRQMEKQVPSPSNALAEETFEWQDEFRRENEHIASQNIVTCREAQRHIDSDITRNIETIKSLQQEDRLMLNEITVEINDIVKNNEQKIKYLQQQNRRLAEQKEILKEKQKSSEEAIRTLAEGDASKEAAVIFSNIESTNSEVNAWIHSFENSYLEERKAKNQIEKATKNMIEKVRIAKDILKSVSEVNKDVDLIPDFSITTAEYTVEAMSQT